MFWDLYVRQVVCRLPDVPISSNELEWFHFSQFYFGIHCFISFCAEFVLFDNYPQSNNYMVILSFVTIETLPLTVEDKYNI